MAIPLSGWGAELSEGEREVVEALAAQRQKNEAAL